jgi:hypothetical protein
LNIVVACSSVVLVRVAFPAVAVCAFAAVVAVVGGCGKKRAEVKAVDEHEGQGASSCLAVPSVVDREVTIGESCALVVERTVVVRAGGKLVVGSGTKIAFERGAGIRVEDGVVVTRGREGAPVIFTSHAPTPAPGNWAGVRSIASHGSSLAWTTIEFAGGDWAVAPPTAPSASASASATGSLLAFGGVVRLQPVEDRAALVVDVGTRDLSLDHVSIVHALHGGASVRSTESIARMSACAFESNGGWSVETVADAAPLLAGNTFGEPVHVVGTVTRSASWPDLPFVVAGTLTVSSPDTPTLTLAPGGTLRFARDASMQIGDGAKQGALVAKTVTFTSAADKPKPGDWGGFDLFASAAATSLDDCTVSYASAASGFGGLGALSAFGARSPVVIVPIARKVHIAHLTFKSCNAPAFSGSTDCDGYESSKLHNVSVGEPLCETAAAMIGTLSALGALSDSGSSAFDAPTDWGSLDEVANGTGGGLTIGSGSGGGGSGGGGAGSIGLGGLTGIGSGSTHDAGVDGSK